MANQGAITAIAGIQDVFEDWRALGHRKLDTGAELIGRVPDADTFAWLHVLYPPLGSDLLLQLEAELGRALPRDLRALYRVHGGMTLFGGAFDVFCLHSAYVHEGAAALQPKDLVQLNHELDMLGWKPSHALAFAVNAWDMSVHLFGLDRDGDPRTVVRCDRRTGKVIEQHQSLWECLCAKLYRLDALMLV